MIKKIFSKRGVNTRVSPRIKAYNFIKYKLAAEPPASFTIANIKDISANGILFVCKRELAKDTVVDIAINFPGIEPIDAKAQVVRTSRTSAGEYQIGAYFINIDEPKRLELAKRIDFILKKIADKKSFLGQLKRIIRR